MVVDAVTGFVLNYAGTVTIGGTRIDRFRPEQRARRQGLDPLLAQEVEAILPFARPLVTHRLGFRSD
jgi:hypothetical protein